MIQYRIHGRGGQGGVTLAKMLAFMYWTEGKWVQAFGSYSAERTGAPIQAFTLIDDIEITNRNRIYSPDHLLIVDASFLGENVLSGLRADGTLLIDTSNEPTSFPLFSGRTVATIDARAIARRHKLGTHATPITNSALAGACARVFDLKFQTVEKTLTSLGFSGANLLAAKDAYNEVKSALIPGSPKIVPFTEPTDPVPPLVTGNLGSEPQLNIADWKSREPYTRDRMAPCNFSCPAGNNVRGFLGEIALGQIDKALATLRATSPLPGSTARVCPHFCEEYCNRGSVDARINMHSLERMAADQGKAIALKPLTSRKEKIAIIGSGPAGLSAAYHLRRKGYACTVLEALPEPGGMLRAGIPDFRLPKNILHDEIKLIEEMGVTIKCNTAIKSNAELKKLTAEFDAVIIAIGLSTGRDNAIAGATAPDLIQGVDLLQKIHFGQKVELGAQVVIIGGGNTAIDTSRVALRNGAKGVTIVYRRTRDEMPAMREEIEAAIHEGVKFKFLGAPESVGSRGGEKFLKVQKMKLGEAGPDGRRSPVAIVGEFEELEFSRIILATGQVAELDFLKGEVSTRNGLIVTNPFGETENAKVFAVGDVATNEGTVTHAIGSGRRAAESVDLKLRGEALPLIPPPEKSPFVTADEMRLHYFTPTGRAETLERPVIERIQDFKEVVRGFDADTGQKEALRCLSCGSCNGCLSFDKGKCELFCPERAINRVSVSRVEVNLSNCKGCLICKEVCPRNAIDPRTRGCAK
ncbi:FAD-dependent oxidoreductase [Bdellovibrionota bacterium FG-2]